MVIRKQRDMPAGGEFAFRLESVVLGVNEEGNEVTSCVVKPLDDQTPHQPLRRSKKLPDSARNALEKLDDLLAREGFTPPGSDHIPQHGTVVTVERFRQHLRDTGVTSGDHPPTERPQWRRAIDNLMAFNEIAIYMDYIWRVRVKP